MKFFRVVHTSELRSFFMAEYYSAGWTTFYLSIHHSLMDTLGLFPPSDEAAVSKRAQRLCGRCFHMRLGPMVGTWIVLKRTRPWFKKPLPAVPQGATFSSAWVFFLFASMYLKGQVYLFLLFS